MRSRLTPTSTSEEVIKSAEEDADKENAEKPAEQKVEVVDKNIRLADLIESGEYNVSIKQKKASASLTNILAVVLLLAVVVGVIIYILLDLKIINANVTLPFDFFK